MKALPKINSISKYLLLFILALVFFSCQKQLDFSSSGINIPPPDLTTKVASSVSGFVTDENNAPVIGATVLVGTTTTTTDKYGFFEAKNVQVVKEAAAVTAIKAGYFKGIKTFIAKEGKSAFFRIKLIPKTIAGTVNAASGGTVSLSNGLSIKLNAGTIVNPATNTQYIGTVNVAAYWISPEAADLNKIMPGDLRGLNSEGVLKTLKTYGMAAVELTGSTGEPLQIVNGQKATLTMAIPASLLASAPASMPLWFFDEVSGLWKEEGVAIKTGSSYQGEVSHFSFWNCDVPSNFVQFDVTLKNTAGNPLPFTLVKITVAGTTTSRWGYTDSSGYVAGAIPSNANLVMEVFAGTGCGNPLYSQTFTTTNVNVSLGIITIATGNNLATLNGTATTCTGAPVTNGYLMVDDDGSFTRYPISNTGTYSVNKIFCSFPQTVKLIAEDVTNTQQSAIVSYLVLSAGANTVANIAACGTTTQQFINYTVNTVPYSFTYPADTFFYSNNNQTAVFLSASNFPPATNNVTMYMNNAGIGVGSSQNLEFFAASQVPDSFRILTPILVNITEYGAIGQFMAGNFTGTFTGGGPANTPYNVVCNFRLRRTN